MQTSAIEFAHVSRTNKSLVNAAKLVDHISGYPSTVSRSDTVEFSSNSSEYAEIQKAENDRKTDTWLLPLIEKLGAQRVLDAGCGVGQTVERLIKHGVDAHGFDLVENVKYWERFGRPHDRYVVTAPIDPILPYEDGCFDFVFSFGVIEHVGTSDGDTTRLADYDEIRRRWVASLLRVVKPGGYLLLAGPNKNFPIDVAHRPDSAASGFEKWLALKLKLTVHKPFGKNFLWSYDDVSRYVGNSVKSIQGLSINDFIYFGRVPKPIRLLTEFYVRKLPSALLKTGCNPWVVALVKK
jgi:SAM-dependent methyltransferase